jgi:hypothetical protein
MSLVDLPAPVRELVTADERFEPCSADRVYAQRIADDVIGQECEDASHAAAQDRWRKANTYSYDGARKVVEAFLLAHGYRVRNVPGAHLAVVEVVDRWLRGSDDPRPRIARSFAIARKARNEDEYPSPRQAERTTRELRALALDNARLVNVVRDALGLPEEPTIVPTPQNLRGRG